MARDEFSEATKRLVAQRASYCCSFPGCENITIGPGSGPESTVNTGQAAHIAAASGGGCRYDPNMTPSERASPDNAIWMCSLHGKTIDSDEKKYDVGTLRAYKVAHESVCEGHIHGQAAALNRLKHRLSESVGIDRKWIPLIYQESLTIHDKEGRYATRSIRQRVLLNENGVRRVRIGDINSTTIAQND